MTSVPPAKIQLPAQFQARICALYGQEGATWLTTLPEIRASLLERWSLKPSQPADHLTYNYLEYAESPDHGPVVLKIGFPNPELETEIKALKVYRTRKQAVNLVASDLTQGALLVERILPGRDLTSLTNEQEASRIVAQTILALQQDNPGGDDFPTMRSWCQGFHRYQASFQGSPGPLPSQIFSAALGLVQELLASPSEQVFLHGDLHHTNLLFRADGTWIGIDPKGVIGELACEVGPFVFNPVPDLIQQPDLEKILDQRFQVLEECTGLDQQRLVAWSFCRAVLAAIWSIEEGASDLAYWIAIAGAIKTMVK